MRWLDPIRAALDASPYPCPVFFRDDDAGWADQRLFALLDVFDRYGVAVDVAAIPTELRPGLTAALTDRLVGSPLRVHQHGYAHANHESTERKHEFGPSRQVSAKAADIAAGRVLMREAFGELCDPIFTPPWNRCTPDIADALITQGFGVLSRDSSAPPVQRPGLAEVPVTVDWFGHRKGARWTPDELAARIAAAVDAAEPLGLMLHHAVTDQAELARVEEVVALLARHPHVRATSIVELAMAPEPAR
ncbi:MAG: hypothetical protein H0V10_16975 [Geodermatophilaceae bacterium]|nr:hypothetical protein [Geodermatophilaceae bacterium]